MSFSNRVSTIAKKLSRQVRGAVARGGAAPLPVPTCSMAGCVCASLLCGTESVPAQNGCLGAWVRVNVWCVLVCAYVRAGGACARGNAAVDARAQAEAADSSFVWSRKAQSPGLSGPQQANWMEASTPPGTPPGKPPTHLDDSRADAVVHGELVFVENASGHTAQETEKASNSPLPFRSHLQSSSAAAVGAESPDRGRGAPPPENASILLQESADCAPYPADPGSLHGSATLDLVRNADVSQFFLASNWGSGNGKPASSVKDGSSQQQQGSASNHEPPTTEPTFMQKVPFQAASPEFALSRYDVTRSEF